jgi:hypothetical protein
MGMACLEQGPGAGSDSKAKALLGFHQLPLHMHAAYFGSWEGVSLLPYLHRHTQA